MNHFRNREPWSKGEEQMLLRLFADSEARGLKVFWCGKWRQAPCYRAAKVLGRTPTAVMDRHAELVRCRKRKEGATP